MNYANSENPHEMAHKELSHLDLHCLQMCVRIYLMSEFTRLFLVCHSFLLLKFMLFGLSFKHSVVKQDIFATLYQPIPAILGAQFLFVVLIFAFEVHI